MERKRIITATPDEVKFIAKAMNVSTVTVYAALKYKASNQVHRKIRKYAIERGNPQMVLTPEFEAIYLTNREDADKKVSRYMVQPFENGATLEANLSTGLAVLRDKNGDVKGQWDSPGLKELSAIQEVARLL